MSQPTLIIVGGPTASGKTALAIEIAKHFNTEIISADSRQCFREMNIGTAKPSEEECAQIKHHFIDELSVTDNVNAGVFCDYAHQKITALSQTKSCIVVTGGTGLYIKALLEGLDDLPPIPEDFRSALKLEYLTKGLTFFTEELKQKDPDHYAKVDLNNPSRVIRAIELIRFTGQPYSSLINKKEPIKKYPSINLCIDLPREILYERINLRVDKMIENGLVREVESLIPYRNHSSLHTVGYSELFDFFDGNSTLEEAIELIKQHSRNYAKRQLTWFKNQGNYQMVKGDLQEILPLISTLKNN
ncbi:MAG: tRNA ((37)-N6)-dimethylallyltransferase MiaA [Bacteroidota bacterium]|jgi:tRNA dimethylallyltransferase